VPKIQQYCNYDIKYNRNVFKRLIKGKEDMFEMESVLNPFREHIEPYMPQIEVRYFQPLQAILNTHVPGQYSEMIVDFEFGAMPLRFVLVFVLNIESR
jgi:hypothetical protein